MAIFLSVISKIKLTFKSPALQGPKCISFLFLFILLPSVLTSHSTPFRENTPRILGCLSSISKNPIGRVGGPKNPQALGVPEDL